MIYIKKNVGFWQFGDRLILDTVCVPLLFASIVEVHIYIRTKCSTIGLGGVQTDRELGMAV